MCNCQRYGLGVFSSRTTTFLESPLELVPFARSTWVPARKRRIRRRQLGLQLVGQCNGAVIVKVFERSGDDGPEVAFHNEKRMLQVDTSLPRMVCHPNVISLVDAFEDVRAFQLVVEFCGGGELFDKANFGLE
eukprot:Skav214537  [mRNA]  locus=scaffold410:546364:547896:+ [translate_table: standard]